MTTTFATLADLLSLPGFRADLKLPRTRGSLTARGLDALDGATLVTEFRPSVGCVPVARYFAFDASSLGGKLGAAPLATILASADLRKLLSARNVDGHGLEMFLDRPASEASLPDAPEGIAILGPIDDAGTLGWWTWYVCAGETTRVLGCFEDFKPETGTGVATNHPAASLAVKLHNGR